MIHTHVLTFPVLLLEDVIKMIGSSVDWFRLYFGLKFIKLSGNYVRAMCLEITYGCIELLLIFSPKALTLIIAAPIIYSAGFKTKFYTRK